MSAETADEYFNKNADWNSTILMNPTKLMEGFAEIKCKEQRENIFKKATKDMAVLANYSLPEADLNTLYNDFEKYNHSSL